MYVMNSTVQMLFQDVARTDYPSAVTFSASLHPMSFNAGIALGSFAGGAVVNAGGLLATGPVGAVLALAAAGLAVGARTAGGGRRRAEAKRAGNGAAVGGAAVGGVRAAGERHGRKSEQKA